MMNVSMKRKTQFGLLVFSFLFFNIICYIWQDDVSVPIITAGQPLPPQPSASEVSAEALANVVEIEGKAKKLTLMQLTERTCKWPIGDPATDDFWFCGHPVQAGKPYCETHVAVAFQPMSTRRSRAR